MKKVFTLILAGLGFFSAKAVQAQCTVIASASPYAVCSGDSSQLTTAATVLGTYYTFDFNDSVLPPGWTVSGGATFSILPACAAPSLDNSPFYWSATSSVTPELQTTDLNVIAGGTINFDFRFKGNSSGSPCETADQYNEGVLLEYSTNAGGSWSTVVYLCSVPAGGPWAFVGGYSQTLLALPGSTTPGNGNGSCGIFDNWAPYVIPIPPAAQTISTRFRWRQPNSSGSCCDNWGLDNINIAAQPNLYYIWENGLAGFGSTSQTLYNITNDTCLTVIVNDTTTGYICLDTVCISVDSLPSLMVNYANPFCVGDLVTLDASLSDPNISSYQWDLDHNGTFEVNTPSSVYAASSNFLTAGNYVITFQGVTGNGCKASLDTVVQVYNNPTVGLTVTDPTVCIYDDADFEALAFLFNASGQSSFVSNYAWDFDFNGTTDASGAALINTTHHFPGLGTYPVVVTVTSNIGCERTDTVNVTIVDIPHGNIVAPQVCGNENALFSFNNTGLPISSYSWNFGDGTTTTDVSSNSNPTYLYPSPGIYGITLIASTSDGCLDTLTSLINIDPLPAGTIPNTSVCQGLDETFAFTQTSADSIVSFNWNFANGIPLTSNLASPTIEFPFGGPTNVSVIITNQYGCTDTITEPFTVNPTPSANFGVYPICISRFTFDPLVNPNDETVVIDWNLGDGTIMNDVDTSLFNHIYTGPGNYNVTLFITDQYGCTDTSSQQVYVDDSLFIEMPNVLVPSSTFGNNQIDMNVVQSAFNLCIDYTYTIFDRWGVQVFQTHNDPYNPDMYCDRCFKGVASNGAPLTPGVYFYVMQGNFNIIKSGSITIFE
jgi:PKD repeat protein